MKQKTLPLYGRKNFSFKMVDFDEGSRKVAGYFSAFGVIDSDSDMMQKGAFAKSIKEAGPSASGNRKIQHLRMHDWDKQIGKLLELKEDDYGLYFVSQLGRSQAGQDAFADYQDGIITEHSIGFNYIPDKLRYVENSDGGYFLVSEVKLWEGSAVTFGANEYTPVLQVAKGETLENAVQLQLEKLQSRSTILLKALKSGNSSDERYHALEAELLSLLQSYSDLVSSLTTEKMQSPKSTAKDQPKKEGEEQKLFYLNLFQS